VVDVRLLTLNVLPVKAISVGVVNALVEADCHFETLPVVIPDTVRFAEFDPVHTALVGPVTVPTLAAADTVTVAVLLYAPAHTPFVTSAR
jgi:hypothetical protein